MQIKAVDNKIVFDFGSKERDRVTLSIEQAMQLTCKCQCGRAGASPALQDAITVAKQNSREAREAEIERLQTRIKELKEIDK